MAWCSICKKEYENDIDICPTCDQNLVDQLDSHIVNDSISDEDILTDEISLTDNFNHFNSSAKPYVMKDEQYQELTSTVWTFLLFGIVGLIFVMLNIVGIINILSGILPNIIMGSLFLFFLWVGISTHHKAKAIQLEIDEENKLTERINRWLSENVTEKFLIENHDDEETEEANYIRISEKVKQYLSDVFGEQDPAYFDKLYEDYYNSHFE